MTLVFFFLQIQKPILDLQLQIKSIAIEYRQTIESKSIADTDTDTTF
jgi:hypothetical protein